MIKNRDGVYVIKDQDANYVHERVFVLTDTGWAYNCFSGITTGFIAYNIKERAEEVLRFLRDINESYGFNKIFSLEYISLKTIKKGESIIKDIQPILI